MDPTYIHKELLTTQMSEKISISVFIELNARIFAVSLAHPDLQTSLSNVTCINIEQK